MARAPTASTSADRIRLEDLDRDTVTAFLDHLTHERANTAATRNARLGAIRVLLAHTLPDHPEHAETIRRISDGESVTSLFAEQNANF